MANCYADEDFAGLWGHENTQDPICSSSRTGLMVTFSNCPLLWVSKVQKEIALYNLHSEYLKLSHSIIALIILKSLIKEVVENLFIGSENLKFVSSSTVYEDNDGYIVVAKIPRMTHTSKKNMSNIIGSGSMLERNFDLEH